MNRDRAQITIEMSNESIYIYVSYRLIFRLCLIFFAVPFHSLHSHLFFNIVALLFWSTKWISIHFYIYISVCVTIWTYTGIGFNEYFFFRKFVAPDWPIPNCVRSTACHKLMIKQYNTHIHPPHSSRKNAAHTHAFRYYSHSIHNITFSII